MYAHPLGTHAPALASLLLPAASAPEADDFDALLPGAAALAGGLRATVDRALLIPAYAPPPVVLVRRSDAEGAELPGDGSDASSRAQAPLLAALAAATSQLQAATASVREARAAAQGEASEADSPPALAALQAGAEALACHLAPLRAGGLAASATSPLVYQRSISEPGESYYDLSQAVPLPIAPSSLALEPSPSRSASTVAAIEADLRRLVAEGSPVPPSGPPFVSDEAGERLAIKISGTVTAPRGSAAPQQRGGSAGMTHLLVAWAGGVLPAYALLQVSKDGASWTAAAGLNFAGLSSSSSAASAAPSQPRGGESELAPTAAAGPLPPSAGGATTVDNDPDATGEEGPGSYLAAVTAALAALVPLPAPAAGAGADEGADAAATPAALPRLVGAGPATSELPPPLPPRPSASPQGDQASNAGSGGGNTSATPPLLTLFSLPRYVLPAGLATEVQPGLDSSKPSFKIDCPSAAEGAPLHWRLIYRAAPRASGSTQVPSWQEGSTAPRGAAVPTPLAIRALSLPLMAPPVQGGEQQQQPSEALVAEVVLPTAVTALGEAVTALLDLAAAASTHQPSPPSLAWSLLLALDTILRALSAAALARHASQPLLVAAAAGIRAALAAAGAAATPPSSDAAVSTSCPPLLRAACSLVRRALRVLAASVTSVRTARRRAQLAAHWSRRQVGPRVVPVGPVFHAGTTVGGTVLRDEGRQAYHPPDAAYGVTGYARGAIGFPLASGTHSWTLRVDTDRTGTESAVLEVVLRNSRLADIADRRLRVSLRTSTGGVASSDVRLLVQALPSGPIRPGEEVTFFLHAESRTLAVAVGAAAPVNIAALPSVEACIRRLEEGPGAVAGIPGPAGSVVYAYPCVSFFGRGEAVSLVTATSDHPAVAPMLSPRGPYRAAASARAKAAMEAFQASRALRDAEGGGSGEGTSAAAAGGSGGPGGNTAGAATGSASAAPAPEAALPPAPEPDAVFLSATLMLTAVGPLRGDSDSAAEAERAPRTAAAAASQEALTLAGMSALAPAAAGLAAAADAATFRPGVVGVLGTEVHHPFHLPSLLAAEEDGSGAASGGAASETTQLQLEGGAALEQGLVLLPHGPTLHAAVLGAAQRALAVAAAAPPHAELLLPPPPVDAWAVTALARFDLGGAFEALSFGAGKLALPGAPATPPPRAAKLGSGGDDAEGKDEEEDEATDVFLHIAAEYPLGVLHAEGGHGEEEGWTPGTPAGRRRRLLFTTAPDFCSGKAATAERDDGDEQPPIVFGDLGTNGAGPDRYQLNVTDAVELVVMLVQRVRVRASAPQPASSVPEDAAPAPLTPAASAEEVARAVLWSCGGVAVALNGCKLTKAATAPTVAQALALGATAAASAADAASEDAEAAATELLPLSAARKPDAAPQASERAPGWPPSLMDPVSQVLAVCSGPLACRPLAWTSEPQRLRSSAEASAPGAPAPCWLAVPGLRRTFEAYAALYEGRSTAQADRYSGAATREVEAAAVAAYGIARHRLLPPPPPRPASLAAGASQVLGGPRASGRPPFRTPAAAAAGAVATQREGSSSPEPASAEVPGPLAAVVAVTGAAPRLPLSVDDAEPPGSLESIRSARVLPAEGFHATGSSSSSSSGGGVARVAAGRVAGSSMPPPHSAVPPPRPAHGAPPAPTPTPAPAPAAPAPAPADDTPLEVIIEALGLDPDIDEELARALWFSMSASEGSAASEGGEGGGSGGGASGEEAAGASEGSAVAVEVETSPDAAAAAGSAASEEASSDDDMPATSPLPPASPPPVLLQVALAGTRVMVAVSRVACEAYSESAAPEEPPSTTSAGSGSSGSSAASRSGVPPLRMGRAAPAAVVTASGRRAALDGVWRPLTGFLIDAGVYDEAVEASSDTEASVAQDAEGKADKGSAPEASDTVHAGEGATDAPAKAAPPKEDAKERRTHPLVEAPGTTSFLSFAPLEATSKRCWPFPALPSVGDTLPEAEAAKDVAAAAAASITLLASLHPKRGFGTSLADDFDLAPVLISGMGRLLRSTAELGAGPRTAVSVGGELLRPPGSAASRPGGGLVSVLVRDERTRVYNVNNDGQGAVLDAQAALLAGPDAAASATLAAAAAGRGTGAAGSPFTFSLASLLPEVDTSDLPRGPDGSIDIDKVVDAYMQAEINEKAAAAAAPPPETGAAAARIHRHNCWAALARTTAAVEGGAGNGSLMVDSGVALPTLPPLPPPSPAGFGGALVGRPWTHDLSVPSLTALCDLLDAATAAVAAAPCADAATAAPAAAVPLLHALLLARDALGHAAFARVTAPSLGLPQALLSRLTTTLLSLLGPAGVLNGVTGAVRVAVSATAATALAYGLAFLFPATSARCALLLQLLRLLSADACPELLIVHALLETVAVSVSQGVFCAAGSGQPLTALPALVAQLSSALASLESTPATLLTPDSPPAARRACIRITRSLRDRLLTTWAVAVSSEVLVAHHGLRWHGAPNLHHRRVRLEGVLAQRARWRSELQALLVALTTGLTGSTPLPIGGLTAPVEPAAAAAALASAQAAGTPFASPAARSALGLVLLAVCHLAAEPDAFSDLYHTVQTTVRALTGRFAAGVAAATGGAELAGRPSSSLPRWLCSAARPAAGARDNFTGQVGYAFTIDCDLPLRVRALGRAVAANAEATAVAASGRLALPHPVCLWDATSETLLACATVDSESASDGAGNALAPLPVPVTLLPGRLYVLTSLEVAGSGDAFGDGSGVAPGRGGARRGNCLSAWVTRRYTATAEAPSWASPLANGSAASAGGGLTFLPSGEAVPFPRLVSSRSAETDDFSPVFYVEAGDKEDATEALKAVAAARRSAAAALAAATGSAGGGGAAAASSGGASSAPSPPPCLEALPSAARLSTLPLLQRVAVHAAARLASRWTAGPEPTFESEAVAPWLTLLTSHAGDFDPELFGKLAGTAPPPPSSAAPGPEDAVTAFLAALLATGSGPGVPKTPAVATLLATPPFPAARSVLALPEPPAPPPGGALPLAALAAHAGPAALLEAFCQYHAPEPRLQRRKARHYAAMGPLWAVLLRHSPPALLSEVLEVWRALTVPSPASGNGAAPAPPFAMPQPSAELLAAWARMRALRQWVATRFEAFREVSEAQKAWDTAHGVAPAPPAAAVAAAEAHAAPAGEGAGSEAAAAAASVPAPSAATAPAAPSSGSSNASTGVALVAGGSGGSTGSAGGRGNGSTAAAPSQPAGPRTIAWTQLRSWAASVRPNEGLLPEGADGAGGAPGAPPPRGAPAFASRLISFDEPEAQQQPRAPVAAPPPAPGAGPVFTSRLISFEDVPQAAPAGGEGAASGGGAGGEAPPSPGSTARGVEAAHGGESLSTQQTPRDGYSNRRGIEDEHDAAGQEADPVLAPLAAVLASATALSATAAQVVGEGGVISEVPAAAAPAASAGEGGGAGGDEDGGGGASDFEGEGEPAVEEEEGEEEEEEEEGSPRGPPGAVAMLSTAPSHDPAFSAEPSTASLPPQRGPAAAALPLPGTFAPGPPTGPDPRIPALPLSLRPAVPPVAGSSGEGEGAAAQHPASTRLAAASAAGPSGGSTASPGVASPGTSGGRAVPPPAPGWRRFLPRTPGWSPPVITRIPQPLPMLMEPGTSAATASAQAAAAAAGSPAPAMLGSVLPRRPALAAHLAASMRHDVAASWARASSNGWEAYIAALRLRCAFAAAFVARPAAPLTAATASPAPGVDALTVATAFVKFGEGVDTEAARLAAEAAAARTSARITGLSAFALLLELVPPALGAIVLRYVRPALQAPRAADAAGRYASIVALVNAVRVSFKTLARLSASGARSSERARLQQAWASFRLPFEALLPPSLMTAPRAANSAADLLGGTYCVTTAVPGCGLSVVLPTTMLTPLTLPNNTSPVTSLGELWNAALKASEATPDAATCSAAFTGRMAAAGARAAWATHADSVAATADPLAPPPGLPPHLAALVAPDVLRPHHPAAGCSWVAQPSVAAAWARLRRAALGCVTSAADTLQAALGSGSSGAAIGRPSGARVASALAAAHEALPLLVLDTTPGSPADDGQGETAALLQAAARLAACKAGTPLLAAPAGAATSGSGALAALALSYSPAAVASGLASGRLSRATVASVTTALAQHQTTAPAAAAASAPTGPPAAPSPDLVTAYADALTAASTSGGAGAASVAGGCQTALAADAGRSRLLAAVLAALQGRLANATAAGPTRAVLAAAASLSSLVGVKPVARAAAAAAAAAREAQEAAAAAAGGGGAATAVEPPAEGGGRRRGRPAAPPPLAELLNAAGPEEATGAADGDVHWELPPLPRLPGLPPAAGAGPAGAANVGGDSPRGGDAPPAALVDPDEASLPQLWRLLHAHAIGSQGAAASATAAAAISSGLLSLLCALADSAAASGTSDLSSEAPLLTVLSLLHQAATLPPPASEAGGAGAGTPVSLAATTPSAAASSTSSSSSASLPRRRGRATHASPTAVTLGAITGPEAALRCLLGVCLAGVTPRVATATARLLARLLPRSAIPQPRLALVVRTLLGTLQGWAFSATEAGSASDAPRSRGVAAGVDDAVAAENAARAAAAAARAAWGAAVAAPGAEVVSLLRVLLLTKRWRGAVLAEAGGAATAAAAALAATSSSSPAPRPLALLQRAAIGLAVLGLADVDGVAPPALSHGAAVLLCPSPLLAPGATLNPHSAVALTSEAPVVTGNVAVVAAWRPGGLVARVRPSSIDGLRAAALAALPSRTAAASHGGGYLEEGSGDGSDDPLLGIDGAESYVCYDESEEEDEGGHGGSDGEDEGGDGSAAVARIRFGASERTLLLLTPAQVAAAVASSPAPRGPCITPAPQLGGFPLLPPSASFAPGDAAGGVLHGLIPPAPDAPAATFAAHRAALAAWAGPAGDGDGNGGGAPAAAAGITGLRFTPPVWTGSGSNGGAALLGYSMPGVAAGTLPLPLTGAVDAVAPEWETSADGEALDVDVALLQPVSSLAPDPRVALPPPAAELTPSSGGALVPSLTGLDLLRAVAALAAATPAAWGFEGPEAAPVNTAGGARNLGPGFSPAPLSLGIASPVPASGKASTVPGATRSGDCPAPTSVASHCATVLASAALSALEALCSRADYVTAALDAGALGPIFAAALRPLPSRSFLAPVALARMAARLQGRLADASAASAAASTGVPSLALVVAGSSGPSFAGLQATVEGGGVAGARLTLGSPGATSSSATSSSSSASSNGNGNGGSSGNAQNDARRAAAQLLVSMGLGFDLEACMLALSHCSGDVNATASWLMSPDARRILNSELEGRRAASSGASLAGIDGITGRGAGGLLTPPSSASVTWGVAVSASASVAAAAGGAAAATSAPTAGGGAPSRAPIEAGADASRSLRSLELAEICGLPAPLCYQALHMFGDDSNGAMSWLMDRGLGYLEAFFGGGDDDEATALQREVAAIDAAEAARRHATSIDASAALEDIPDAPLLPALAGGEGGGADGGGAGLGGGSRGLFSHLSDGGGGGVTVDRHGVRVSPRSGASTPFSMTDLSGATRFPPHGLAAHRAAAGPFEALLAPLPGFGPGDRPLYASDPQALHQLSGRALDTANGALTLLRREGCGPLLAATRHAGPVASLATAPLGLSAGRCGHLHPSAPALFTAIPLGEAEGSAVGATHALCLLLPLAVRDALTGAQTLRYVDARLLRVEARTFNRLLLAAGGSGGDAAAVAGDAGAGRLRSLHAEALAAAGVYAARRIVCLALAAKPTAAPLALGEDKGGLALITLTKLVAGASQSFAAGGGEGGSGGAGAGASGSGEEGAASTVSSSSSSSSSGSGPGASSDGANGAGLPADFFEAPTAVTFLAPRGTSAVVPVTVPVGAGAMAAMAATAATAGVAVADGTPARPVGGAPSAPRTPPLVPSLPGTPPIPTPPAVATPPAAALTPAAAAPAPAPPPLSLGWDSLPSSPVFLGSTPPAAALSGGGVPGLSLGAAAAGASTTGGAPGSASSTGLGLRLALGGGGTGLGSAVAGLDTGRSAPLSAVALLSGRTTIPTLALSAADTERRTGGGGGGISFAVGTATGAHETAGGTAAAGGGGVAGATPLATLRSAATSALPLGGDLPCVWCPGVPPLLMMTILRAALTRLLVDEVSAKRAAAAAAAAPSGGLRSAPVSARLGMGFGGFALTGLASTAVVPPSPEYTPARGGGRGGGLSSPGVGSGPSTAAPSPLVMPLSTPLLSSLASRTSTLSGAGSGGGEAPGALPDLDLGAPAASAAGTPVTSTSSGGFALSGAVPQLPGLRGLPLSRTVSSGSGNFGGGRSGSSGASGGGVRIAQQLLEQCAQNFLTTTTTMTDEAVSASSGGPPGAVTIESLHPFFHRCDYGGEVLCEGAKAVRVTFDPRCELPPEGAVLTFFSDRACTQALASYPARRPGSDGGGSGSRVERGHLAFPPLVVHADRVYYRFVATKRDDVPHGWGYRATAAPMRGLTWTNEAEVLEEASLEWACWLLGFLLQDAARHSAELFTAVHHPAIYNAMLRYVCTPGAPFRARVLELVTRLLLSPHAFPRATPPDLRQALAVAQAVMARVKTEQAVAGRAFLPPGLLRLVEFAQATYMARRHFSGSGAGGGAGGGEGEPLGAGFPQATLTLAPAPAPAAEATQPAPVSLAPVTPPVRLEAARINGDVKLDEVLTDLADLAAFFRSAPSLADVAAGAARMGLLEPVSGAISSSGGVASGEEDDPLDALGRLMDPLQWRRLPPVGRGASPAFPLPVSALRLRSSLLCRAFLDGCGSSLTVSTHHPYRARERRAGLVTFPGAAFLRITLDRRCEVAAGSALLVWAGSGEARQIVRIGGPMPAPASAAGPAEAPVRGDPRSWLGHRRDVVDIPGDSLAYELWCDDNPWTYSDGTTLRSSSGAAAPAPVLLAASGAGSTVVGHGFGPNPLRLWGASFTVSVLSWSPRAEEASQEVLLAAASESPGAAPPAGEVDSLHADVLYPSLPSLPPPKEEGEGEEGSAAASAPAPTPAPVAAPAPAPTLAPRTGYGAGLGLGPVTLAGGPRTNGDAVGSGGGAGGPEAPPSAPAAPAPAAPSSSSSAAPAPAPATEWLPPFGAPEAVLGGRWSLEDAAVAMSLIPREVDALLVAWANRHSLRARPSEEDGAAPAGPGLGGGIGAFAAAMGLPVPPPPQGFGGLPQTAASTSGGAASGGAAAAAASESPLLAGGVGVRAGGGGGPGAAAAAAAPGGGSGSGGSNTPLHMRDLLSHLGGRGAIGGGGPAAGSAGGGAAPGGSSAASGVSRRTVAAALGLGAADLRLSRKELSLAFRLLSALPLQALQLRLALLRLLNARVATASSLLDLSSAPAAPPSAVAARYLTAAAASAAGIDASGSSSASSAAFSPGAGHSLASQLRALSHLIFAELKNPLLDAAVQLTWTPARSMPRPLITLDNALAMQGAEGGNGSSGGDPTSSPSLFGQMYRALTRALGSAGTTALFRGRIDERGRLFSVRFANEQGIDYGGVFRDALTRAIEDLASDRIGLFVPTPNARAAAAAAAVVEGGGGGSGEEGGLRLPGGSGSDWSPAWAGGGGSRAAAPAQPGASCGTLSPGVAAALGLAYWPVPPPRSLTGGAAGSGATPGTSGGTPLPGGPGAAPAAAAAAAGGDSLYVPNPRYCAPGALPPRLGAMYEFTGKVMGMALRTKLALPFQFPALVWKGLLGQATTLADLQEVDAPLVAHLLQVAAWMPPLSAAAGGETSPAAVAAFARAFPGLTFAGRDAAGGTLELVPGGAAIPVTPATRLAYVGAATRAALSAYDPVLRRLGAGLASVVPPRVLALLTGPELEVAVSGVPDVDVAVLRAQTDYEGYRRDDPTVGFFWAALSSFSREERALFLRFAWGRSRLPPSARLPRRFKIQRRPGGDSDLPLAHTCFFSIELAPKSSLERMVWALRTAIYWGSGGVLNA